MMMRVVVYVPDADRAAKLLEVACGIPRHAEVESPREVILGTGPTLLAFVGNPWCAAATVPQVNVVVYTDDLYATLNRLLLAGARVVAAPIQAGNHWTAKVDSGCGFVVEAVQQVAAAS